MRVWTLPQSGYEKSNAAQANAPEVFAPAPTLQSDSQSSGIAIGSRACREGKNRTFLLWSLVVIPTYLVAD
jgi:hypothetical protein